MKPSTSLYWIRAVLGVVIGGLDGLFDYSANIDPTKFSIDYLFTGLSFALLFFIITYYLLKIFYINKFQKKSKVLSTGIGAYFILWIVAWVLVYSIIRA